MRRSQDTMTRLNAAISERFGEHISLPKDVLNADELARILEHRSHRAFTEKPVSEALLRFLFACALSAPSKSDLQQADIVWVVDPPAREAFADLIPNMPWVHSAPVFLVFCANNRRIRQIGEMRGKPFANDHLDAFMNAAVDAAIVMTTFIRAATVVGLGCCPISAIRDHAKAVNRLLALPQWVFPVAGLCLGYPAREGQISPRLPMDITVHVDRYNEDGLQQKIEAYDQRRHVQQPITKQRYVELYGSAAFYGWSEDKARHYSRPERADFGRYIREKGFNLE
ncbi:MAG: nitroreductase family protein [Acidiferrobacterales bacterium]